MHEYRALGRGDGSNLSEPVGVTAAMAPRGWFVSGSSLIPAMGGPLLWAWRGTERDIIPEGLLGGRGTCEGKPEGLLLWFCGDNCVPRLEQ